MTKFILSFILFLPFVFSSCSDDDKDGGEGDNTNKTYKVRYEASCDNPDVTMRILYSTKNTDIAHVEEDAKVVYAKSPFSVELEMKYAEVCYISAQQHVDDNATALENVNVTTIIIVDGIKKFTATNKSASVSYYGLGSEQQ